MAQHGDDQSHVAAEAEAGTRTTYAADRTVLANERTYAAWIRTGLAALAAGVAFEKFLVDVMPDWSVRAIAVILILVSAGAFAVAAWRYTHLDIKVVHPELKSIPSLVTTTVSILLIGCSLIALLGLWLMNAPGGLPH